MRYSYIPANRGRKTWLNEKSRPGLQHAHLLRAYGELAAVLAEIEEDLFPIADPVLPHYPQLEAVRPILVPYLNERLH